MSKMHPVHEDEITRTGLENGGVAEAKAQTLEDVFAITEIKIEELSIDGICGVY